MASRTRSGKSHLKTHNKIRKGYAGSLLEGFVRASQNLELVQEINDEAIARLSELSSDTNDTISGGNILTLVFPLWQLSNVFQRSCVSRLISAEYDLAYQDAVNACLTMLVMHRIEVTGRLALPKDVNQHPRKWNGIPLVLAFCLSMSLERKEESKFLYRMVKLLLSPQPNMVNAIYTINDYFILPSFCVDFFESVYMQQPPSLPADNPYRPLLASLESSEAVFSSALTDACEYHIANSRDNNNQRSFEFDATFFRVYPAEILMTVSARRSRNLPITVPKNRITQLPTFFIFERTTVIVDNIIQTILDRINATEDIFSAY